MAGVRVEQVALPGIGMRYDVITSSGRRVGVVAHRTGRRDLVVYDVDDPDTAAEQILLTDDEARTLADVLTATLVLGQLSGMPEQAAGLATEQIAVPADSPFIGHRLGETRTRTRTGAYIVAVMRAGTVISSPGPEQVLAAGDVLVVVGTRAGLDGVMRLIADG